MSINNITPIFNHNIANDTRVSEFPPGDPREVLAMKHPLEIDLGLNAGDEQVGSDEYIRAILAMIQVWNPMMRKLATANWVARFVDVVRNNPSEVVKERLMMRLQKASGDLLDMMEIMKQGINAVLKEANGSSGDGEAGSTPKA